MFEIIFYISFHEFRFHCLFRPVDFCCFYSYFRYDDLYRCSCVCALRWIFMCSTLSVFALNCCDTLTKRVVFFFAFKMKINMNVDDIYTLFFPDYFVSVVLVCGVCVRVFFLIHLPLKPFEENGEDVCVFVVFRMRYIFVGMSRASWCLPFSLGNARAFIKGFNYCALNHFVYSTSTRRL